MSYQKQTETDYNTKKNKIKCVVCGKENTSENRIDWEGGSACKNTCYMVAISRSTMPPAKEYKMRECHIDTMKGKRGKYGTGRFSSFNRIVNAINGLEKGAKTDHKKIYDKVYFKSITFSEKTVRNIINVFSRVGYLKRLDCHGNFMVVKRIPASMTVNKLWRKAGY